MQIRVDASLSDPFLLSTYSTTHQLTKSSASNKGQRKSTSLYTTHEKASGSSDGYATVTAQADGVHVLDISTLHPVISHTLGPSTTFTCPAVTRNTRNGADSICTTYAAIEASTDLPVEENGRTIWIWSEALSSRLEDRAAQKKKSVLIPHQISGLYTCDELPALLLAQSPQAELTILDGDSSIKNTWTSPQATESILRTFVYSRTACLFSPSHSSPPRGATVVSVIVSKNSTFIRVISVDDDGAILELGNASISLKPEQILDLTCSKSGYVSFITRDGTWHSYRLTSKNGTSVEASPVSEPFRLTGLSFISNSDSSEELSILSLSSSYVLLSAFSDSSSPEIVILLWDLQYSVLLASQSLPVPSTLTQAENVTVKMTLVSASTSQALLVLSPHASSSGKKPKSTSSRSSVLVVPLTCSELSTIANAMGRGPSSAKWIDQAVASSSSAPSHDPARAKVLSTMGAAMEKNLPQAANVAFFEWEKRESKAAAAKPSEDTADMKKATTSSVHLDYAFIKDLLATVLQPLKPANTPYSSEIVCYLLNRKLVSSDMLSGGLLAALRHKNDWQSVNLALANVIDLSEAEIMETLHIVAVQHRLTQASATQEDSAMDVDSTSDLPSLSTFLSSCVTYATTPPALRAAMRQFLKEAEDVVVVLRVLENWTKQWSRRNIRLLPSKKDLSKNGQGVLILREREKPVNPDLPPLPNVLSFLQTLFDASFLALLQHSPSHAVIRKIKAHIEPEITYIDDVEQLRGPLETFAKAHSKAIKEAGQDKRKKQHGDWRQRRKQAHEQAGLSIGLYQLEELVL